MRPSVDVADRHGDRAAGVDDLHAAREAVGGVHGDRAHAVVAEVLLHLADEVGARAAGELLVLVGFDSRLMTIAELISGSLSGKTASMTTPWISSIRPTLRVSVSVVAAIVSLLRPATRRRRRLP